MDLLFSYVSGGVRFSIMTSLLTKVIINKKISIDLFTINENILLEYNLLL
jgi:hypothetical protein